MTQSEKDIVSLLYQLVRLTQSGYDLPNKLSELASKANIYIGRVTDHPYRELITKGIEELEMQIDALTKLSSAKNFEAVVDTTLQVLKPVPPKGLPPAPPAPEASKYPYGLDFPLNDDQANAIARIKEWLAGDEPYFALRGYAGTGKSTILKILTTLDYNLLFSAPTNKASKVLSDMVGRMCKTTYSLLGVRMEADEDELVLKVVPDAPYLGTNVVLVIDEAGQVPKVLVDLLVERGYRCLFVGDPAQLNPVGENNSKVWGLAGKNRVTLRKVERFDNQLLKLSVALRGCLRAKNWESPIKSDNDKVEGVFLVTRKVFEDKIMKVSLEDWGTTKVCCWRNRTVDAFNNLIRENLGFKETYEVGDRLLLATPHMESNVIVGHIDEELQVTEVATSLVRVIDAQGEVHKIDCWSIKSDKPWIVTTPMNTVDFDALLTSSASYARAQRGTQARDAWSAFWAMRHRFTSLRYGYAMTAHRLQGTTLTDVFVTQYDVLANPNKVEAFRALYVAATRPTRRLIVC